MIKIKQIRKTKQISIRIDNDLHKILKIIAIERDTSIQKITENFLKCYIADYQKYNEKIPVYLN